MDFLAPLISLRRRAQQERCTKLAKKIMIKDMPYVYSLIAVASSSGLSAEASLRCISKYVPPSVFDSVANAVDRIDSGQSFREALSTWEQHPHMRSLAHILTESMESGTSALPALDAMTRDALAKVRRSSDIAMKKLPVTMLFPLVVCILPAFMLLSVIPTLISGFMSLDL